MTAALTCDRGCRLFRWSLRVVKEYQEFWSTPCHVAGSGIGVKSRMHIPPDGELRMFANAENDLSGLVSVAVRLLGIW